MSVHLIAIVNDCLFVRMSTFIINDTHVTTGTEQILNRGGEERLTRLFSVAPRPWGAHERPGLTWHAFFKVKGRALSRNVAESTRARGTGDDESGGGGR